MLAAFELVLLEARHRVPQPGFPERKIRPGSQGQSSYGSSQLVEDDI